MEKSVKSGRTVHLQQKMRHDGRRRVRLAYRRLWQLTEPNPSLNQEDSDETGSIVCTSIKPEAS